MRTVQTTRPGISLSAVLIVAMCVLLPILAFLQYRWIGDLSRAERQRLEDGLTAATSRFSDDLNRELSDVALGFEVRGGETTLALEAQISGNFEHWTRTSRYAGIVEAVYVAAPAAGKDLELLRFDTASGALEASPWPTALQDLPARLDALSTFPATAAAARVDRLGRLWDSRAGGDSLWLLAPVLSTGARFNRGAAPAFAGWILVEMNSHALAENLLPDLVATHFEASDYKIAIFQSPSSDTVVFLSEDGLSRSEMENPDVSIRALLPGDGPGRRAAGRRRGFPRPPSSLSQSAREGGPGRAFGANRGRFALIGADWQLQVRHQAGSLDNAVAAIRERNLAAGLGILALLGLSGVLAIVWAERVRSIGRLQMEFAAGISHELRTPLATIRTAAHNIASGVVTAPEQVREYAEMVQNEGRRLSTMVDQVMQFAQTESGRRKYRIVPVELGDAVNRALTVVFASPEEAEQRVRILLDPALPEVLVDETALTHSLENLITNALKYGASGRKVTIAGGYDSAAGRVRLDVTNAGPGIDASDLPHIFQPFYRGGNAGRTPGSGLGLGLVRKMIRSQNGEVTVQSGPDTGTTFTLHLPVPRTGRVAGFQKEQNRERRSQ